MIAIEDRESAFRSEHLGAAPALRPHAGGLPAGGGVRPQAARARRGQAPLPISVCVELVAPPYRSGGASRGAEAAEPLGPAALRSQLRFWWRALHGQSPDFDSEPRLRRAERALWGEAQQERGERAAVEIHVDPLKPGEVEAGGLRSFASIGAPAGARPGAGAKFWLTLVGPGDAASHADLCNVVRAWMLFGGCGDRTWRGHGGLTVGDRRMAPAWLPGRATREALKDLFGYDVLAPRGRGLGDFARLAGSRFHAGETCCDPAAATRTALGWLEQLRRLRSGARVAARSGGVLEALGLREPRRRSAGEDKADVAPGFIAKALPLAGGCFAPIALLLNRGLAARAGARMAAERAAETPK